MQESANESPGDPGKYRAVRRSLIKQPGQGWTGAATAPVTRAAWRRKARAAVAGDNSPARRLPSLLLLGSAALAGCVSYPTASELRATVAAFPGRAPLPGEDGRARFREIFCSLAAPGGEPPSGEMSCNSLLWRLADEPVPGDPPASLPTLAARLHIFVVSGAFGDCRKLDTVPYGDGIERLAAQGVAIQAVMVSGRSGVVHNARQIADAVEAAHVPEGDHIVLIGYSKGALDIMQFLLDYPEFANQVAAVVSVAGPILGSPLASTADWWYRELFARSFSSTCDPGDGRVLESLLPDVRRQWLAEHPLPAQVRYFSLASFTTRKHLGRGLRMTWAMLADDDIRNDGQVLVEDAVIPGSVLLGYANADHWDVAISIDKQMPYLSARPSARHFPRNTLLDAMLLYVSESLASSRQPAP